MALLKEPPKTLIPALRVGVLLLWAATITAAAGGLGPGGVVAGCIVGAVALSIHLIECTTYMRRGDVPRTAAAGVDVAVFGMLAVWDRKGSGR